MDQEKDLQAAVKELLDAVAICVTPMNKREKLKEEGCLYFEIADIMFHYYIVSVENGEIRKKAIFKRSLTEKLDISEEEIREIALKNTMKSYPVKVMGMSEVLSKYEFCDPGEFYLDGHEFRWIVTTEGHYNGATALAYPGVLNQIADQMGDDLRIIPSSVHECIIVPDSIVSHESAQDCREMITFVNNLELPEDERLSDHAYIFRRDTGKLEVMA